MDDCIFCKIVSKDLPAHIFYEDDTCIGVLDLFPSHYGQAWVAPKQHVDSQFSTVDAETLNAVMHSAQTVARLLETKLDNVSRCIALVEGMEVSHFHVKLYPALLPDPGKYALSQGGAKADQAHMEKLTELLRKK